MNIKHSEPEEQSGGYAASWRELKTRHGVSKYVYFASLFSSQFMIMLLFHKGYSKWPLVLVGWLAALAAIHLADRLVRDFRCPHCGHPFFNPKSNICLVIGKLCNHCGLKLWSTEGLNSTQGT